MTPLSCQWTLSEEDLLKNLAGRASVNKISSLMGRSRQSIRSKATKLGLSLNFKRTQWDDDLLKEIIKLRGQGLDWVSIGKKLKKSPASCQRAFSRQVCADKKNYTKGIGKLVNQLEEILENSEIPDEQKIEILTKFKEKAAQNELL